MKARGGNTRLLPASLSANDANAGIINEGVLLKHNRYVYTGQRACKYRYMLIPGKATGNSQVEIRVLLAAL